MTNTATDTTEDMTSKDSTHVGFVAPIYAICQVTNSNQRTSLLDLPPEIWSKTGKLVIEDSNPLTGGAFARERQPQTRWHQPPLTRTCRVLRNELLPQFYKTRVKIICVAREVQMGFWLRTIGLELRKVIRGVFVFSTIGDSLQELKERAMDNWGVELELEQVEERHHWSDTEDQVIFV